MKLEVLNIEGKSTGREVSLPESAFGIESPSEQAMYQDVRLYLANQRQGTHKTKERGEVSGSNKKPYRQKGTGNARPGHKRSPLWRHGGTIFGPKPRDYGFKLNKKVKSLARRSALSLKATSEKIAIIENFEFEGPKTKNFVNILNSFELTGTKVLLVTPELNRNVFLSGRNIPKAQVMRASDLNTYDILNADKLLIMEDALNIIDNNA